MRKARLNAVANLKSTIQNNSGLPKDPRRCVRGRLRVRKFAAAGETPMLGMKRRAFITLLAALRHGRSRRARSRVRPLSSDSSTAISRTWGPWWPPSIVA